MAELKFNNLPFKSFEDWENMQKDEPTEILTALTALQKTISKELRRRKAEEKQTKLFEKWAATHGYEFTKKPEKAKEEKLEEKKSAAATPFKM
jgi:IS30 family transposase